MPDRFYDLENLLQNMPIHLPNGEGGLLAKGQLVDAIKDLPQYDVTNINDQRLLSGKWVRDKILFLKNNTHGYGQ